MKVFQNLVGRWMQLVNWCLQHSAGAPEGIQEGGVYYDTTDQTPKYFDGTESKPFGQNDHAQLDNLDVGDPHPQYVLGSEIGVTIPPLTAGKIPTSYLPSYVDDVLEFANLSAFPVVGEAAKIYVALDTNKIYRWTGSAYGEISSSIALGETSATAYRGDRGALAFTHSQTAGNPHGTTKADLGLGSVDNTSDASKPISTATQTALNAKQNSDATLTALSALDTTKGILVQTGTDTFLKRSLVNGLGTIVGNGTGETANPYVNVDFEATASNIKSNGTQAVGTRNTAARGDHVHPSDTSKVSNAPEYTLSGLGVTDNLWGKIAEISGMNATYNRGSFVIICNIMNGSYFDIKLSVECSSGDASPNIIMRQYSQATAQMFTAKRNGLVWEIWMRSVSKYDKAYITILQKDPTAATYTFFNASANTASVTGTAPTIVLGLSSTQYSGLVGGSATTLHTHANATSSAYGLVQIEDAVTDGSTKAVTSNAVYDALATKESTKPSINIYSTVNTWLNGGIYFSLPKSSQFQERTSHLRVFCSGGTNQVEQYTADVFIAIKVQSGALSYRVSLFSGSGAYGRIRYRLDQDANWWYITVASYVPAYTNVYVSVMDGAVPSSFDTQATTDPTGLINAQMDNVLFQSSTGSYGTAETISSNGGYAGISALGQERLTLMSNADAGYSGLYNETQSKWLILKNLDGTLTIGYTPASASNSNEIPTTAWVRDRLADTTVGNATNAGNANTVDGKHIVVQSVGTSTSASNTLYFMYQ